MIIDHHRRSADIIEDTLLNYIEVYASSTSEMVTEIIQYMVERPNLTELEAEGLLAGIYMDTKGFSFKTGIYISARSIGEINVQIVLEALGGGGHMNMAGAKISNEPIEKVVADLKDAMKKYLRVGE